jgi:hypothetical protein
MELPVELELDYYCHELEPIRKVGCVVYRRLDPKQTRYIDSLAGISKYRPGTIILLDSSPWRCPRLVTTAVLSNIKYNILFVSRQQQFDDAPHMVFAYDVALDSHQR